MYISATKDNSLKVYVDIAILIAMSMRFIAMVTSKCAICVAGKYNGEDITSRNIEKARSCEVRKGVKRELCFKKLYYNTYITNM